MNQQKVKPYLLCGDTPESHNRIAGENDFFAVTENIRSSHGAATVVIGLSRYNFFRMGAIYKYCLELLGVDTGAIRKLHEPFPVFPMVDIVKNAALWVAQLNALNPSVQIELFDDQLMEIFGIITLNAGRSEQEERNFFRLLGIICENAFIGPQTIVIDPFHRCNVQCAHCFVHNPSIHHPDEFLNRKLTLANFTEIITDAVELKTDVVILQGDGEPLMHPDFIEMIRHIRSTGMRAIFFTNGSLLNESMAKEIIDADVSELLEAAGFVRNLKDAA